MHNEQSASSPEKKPRRRSWFGPGLLISASFIGPGTVTTATVAGADFGFALAWAVVFSILATIILQEMSARLGVMTNKGLGEIMRETFTHPLSKTFMIVLVVAAIGVGGASYAGGDTTGTALAIDQLIPLPMPVLAAIVGAILLLLLLTGSYKIVERVMTVLVIIMALVFFRTVIVVRPDFGAFLSGVFAPSLPAGSALTAIALIGTTVVPYNVFLHSSLVQEKWGHEPDREQSLKEAKVDNAVSISIGGLITLAVLATSAGTLFVHGVSAESAADMATQLEPLLGPAAHWVFAIGLFAAGLTSALAGPLGAAYAICGIVGWKADMSSWPFRLIALGVVVIGIIIAVTGVNPVTVIVVAQAANGLILPIIAGFLLYTMNKARALGTHRNGVVANILGFVTLLVVTGLAIYQLADLFIG
ncbi:Nramp family divalent metal transporter [Auritidibacter ignavus]|uniref:Nramp family divalent metal transporter n=1 Tax=Auritidibacter ignavus TaxID=678932 RepID=UPI00109D0F63|nr:Nramp family divalent metal transporter [Auritidibacter ignavus]